MSENPYVDFYTILDISPVRQDISDLEIHFKRRDALFRSVGILPSLVKDKSILEFGPGRGHNAIFTAYLKPKRYVLVDGNKRGIDDCKANLKSEGMSLKKIEFVHTLFQDYESDHSFDIVLAEGSIPGQFDPVSILRHISTFVHSGGVLVITTVSALSCLSEIMRRLVRDIKMNPNEDPDVQLNILMPLLEPHLKTLKGMSRLFEDWILDNIVQPNYKVKLFSVPEAVDALKYEFDVYGTSPRFITDWRWYKDIIGKDRGFNELAIDAYYKNNLNFLDYRFVFPQHSREFGEMLEAKCAAVWDLMCQLESGTMQNWDPIWGLLEEIYTMIADLAPGTALALREAISWLQEGAKESSLKNFPQWFGRGQQYVSFIRR